MTRTPHTYTHATRIPAGPILDHHGVDPLGPYPEKFWLPIIGPTALLAARHLHRATENGTIELDLDEMASRLGVGHNGRTRSALNRSIDRAIGFGVLRHDGATTIQCPTRWAPIPSRLHRLLSPTLLGDLQGLDENLTIH